MSMCSNGSRNSPLRWSANESAGITEPADLVGRAVGVPGFFGASYVGLVGLLNANGLTLDDIDASEIGFNQIESLLTDASESVVVYANNEPVQLQTQGEAIDIIQVSEYIDLVGNGIIANEQTIAENPALVEGFTRALLRGTADTLNNPDEAYEISKKFVEGLDDSRRNVLEATLPFWESPTPGVTDPASWVTMQDVLLSMGFIDAPLADLSQAFTNQFVTETQP